ncbi:purine-binding chemotaxis protein CheW [Hydrogenoanaerobacterium saccharovorans]|uniref:Chemotaxis protein CheW n=1 Tax=Hydrogenoanaerobacterium saccharovorans TaxID=474960 RepID=A0A1H7ZAI6_9FIRM|nr:chemotaxis protein CheW [Hydrogenoanaerobacterium saccharovorans]RPF48730.1 purine-binding chemotaxis protein CheW [Hydrogenoanaerobacterium saccharovorans]SEM55263.1 purine-binding chemotaxis protein CheW [Hydrogenoanaerobacterium saccharovorans]
MNENINASTALDDLMGRFLTFYIGDTIYGVELLHVLEIISIQAITSVPKVPNYIKGIINLRGKIVPVVDVRLKLGKEEREYDERTCIIVVSIDEMSVGLIVDRVSEVVDIDNVGLSAPPELSSSSTNQYLSSIAKIEDKVILNIDLERFFFEEIGGIL